MFKIGGSRNKLNYNFDSLRHPLYRWRSPNQWPTKHFSRLRTPSRKESLKGLNEYSDNVVRPTIPAKLFALIDCLIRDAQISQRFGIYVVLIQQNVWICPTTSLNELCEYFVDAMRIES
ncbi:hypothetical protein Pla22_32020 [Rubripirellula amarantea]|uniref:Uncharacterized protein n=1 Tax=Rubripirellula amarantea TaxID=2527999 RepID=A0A5C5WJZ6_9BACT|nr:hypothetical protein Pla22_32020 [Rubripirellula amarantea]